MVDPSLTRRVATSLSAHQDVESAGADLLQATLEITGASQGAVYLLSLTNGRYEPLHVHLAEASAHPWPPISTDQFNPRWSNADLTRCIPASRFLGRTAPGVAVLAFRESTCLAALLLMDFDWDSASSVTQLALESTAALLVPVFERRFTTDLLSSLQMPLDFTRPEPEFLEQVGELIGLSAGMEFSAIRELEEDASLTCLGFWSHGGESQSQSLDISDPSTLPPFQAAIEGQTTAVADVAEVPEMAPFLEKTGLNQVRSFVVIPVRVGPTLFGVLSVAARCPFDYTEIELAGFESIANGLGVALRNFRSFHEATGKIHEMTKTGFAITALEVATSVRHEALNLIEEGQNKLLDVSNSVSGPQAATLNAASEKLAAASKALHKIRLAANPPDRALKRVNLKELFGEARGQVHGRLQKERIQCVYTGPDVKIDAYPDYLRSAFENLLFNSIDALQESKRRGRSIEFTVARPSPKDTHVKATFRDNGPGIQKQRLRVPTGEEVEQSVQSIFEPGVTSKSNGSGFGLWLVRRIITDHRGSIDLRDYRQGTVFELKLQRERPR